MSELTLIFLRFAILGALWVFVFVIVYSLRSDLFGPRARKLPVGETGAAASMPSHPAPNRAPASANPFPSESPFESALTEAVGTVSRLVISTGPKKGMTVELGRDPLTIGRSSESGLVLRDDYTSTHHARLMLWDNTWMIQDLDSTNGTFLDGRRVTVPTPVPLNTPIKVGATTFELRR